MRCIFPYNENFVVFAKKYAGGNGTDLIINFTWPYMYITSRVIDNFYKIVFLLAMLTLVSFVTLFVVAC